MYLFLKLTPAIGRHFAAWCKRSGGAPEDIARGCITGFCNANPMTVPEPEKMGEGLDRMTRIYIKMRDTRKALKKQWEAEDEAIKEQMETISNHLLDKLNTDKVKSMKTETATFYKQEVFKPSCADWDAFYKFIKDEDAFEFLEKRVTKTAIEKYVAEHEKLPPGINVHREYEVIVRRGTNH